MKDKQPSLISEKEFSAETIIYITACVPVYREQYKCVYDPNENYKPKYTKVSENFIFEDTIFGIVNT